jgi:putative RNA 2'-phosphotransferase
VSGRGRDVRLSKRLAYVLRHDPASAGVTLSVQGWTDVDALLAGLARTGLPVTRADLERVVAGSEKQRFALDGDRIRAQQGHSVPVDLGLAPVDPPDVLFHGTVERFLPAVLAEGLLPRRRHHVHLSPDVATATAVGARRGRPVVLAVAAGRLRRDGRTFYRSGNGVWLVDAVPPDALTVLDGA